MSNAIDRDSINSPIRYVGGKHYARKQILPIMPNHNMYVEPFCGGASIFFAKEKAEKNWLNDADPDLINTLINIRDNPELLADIVMSMPISKEKHAYYKKEYLPTTPIEKAARWFYLNRTSFSGIMNMKNCCFSYDVRYTKPQQRWGEIILKASEKLKGVVITCCDFEDLFAQLPVGADNQVLMFIDPPHYNAEKGRLHSYDMSPSDHDRLAACMRLLPSSIQYLACYDDCQRVRELFGWSNVVLGASFGGNAGRSDYNAIGDIKGKRVKMPELFIASSVVAQSSYSQKLLKA